MRIKTPRFNWQNYKFGSITLCMIMRNEERWLKRCLDSVIDVVDEIVIVDTGSTDKSIEIAKSYGAIIYNDPWQDDFARPRNIGLAAATREWILILDPDEVIMKKDHDKIRWLTRAKNINAWWLTTRNYNNARGDISYRSIAREDDPLGQYAGFVPSTKTRFFRNGLGIRFKGCWHELVDWYLMANKIVTAQSDVVVHHWAHEILQKDVREKMLFSLKMGEKKTREWPSNGQAWWELAVAEAIIGYRARAANSLARAFRLGFGGQGQYFTLARILRLLGDNKKADLAFEKGVCKLFPALTHISVPARNITTLIDGL